MALLYNLGLLALSPLLLAYLIYRVGILGKSREGLGQRFGWMPALGAPDEGGRVWMHAVSAGEMVAAAAVARRLLELQPATELVISTVTPAGMQQAQRLLPQAAAAVYFPFDLLPCVWLAYRRLRPTVICAVETEIWPNWLWLGRLLGVRSALVNGQFADKGYRRAVRAPWLYRWALGNLDALVMQAEQGRERALRLGADPLKIRVTGNVKFEQAEPPHAEALVSQVRAAFGPAERPILIAASTHPGEDEQVLQAYRRVREAVPDCALLLAPRHVQRAGAVAELCRAEGFATRLRSDPAGALLPSDVMVLDTMGELAALYRLGVIAFVGGSLTPIGGHDVIQPLMAGVPALVGPHTHNQADVVNAAIEAGGVRRVADAGDLAEQLLRLLGDPEERDGMRQADTELLARNRGAASLCAETLAQLLDGASGWAA